MATSREKARVGLGPVRNRDTIRCVVPEARRGEITKDVFVEEILFALLRLGPREILSLQHFPSQASFEVTFRSTELLQLGKKRLEENVSNELLDGLMFSSSDVYSSVIVHSFNPHTLGEDIATFLQRYCTEVREGVKLFDRHGLWNCRRRYRVRFRTRDGGITIYPPHSFHLGPDRCHLTIEGQPGVCWKCGEVGHQLADCTARVCRYCGSTEHMADACTAVKTCSLCGSEGHLFRMCPRRWKGPKDAESPSHDEEDNGAAAGPSFSEAGTRGSWAQVVEGSSPYVFRGGPASAAKGKGAAETTVRAPESSFGERLSRKARQKSARGSGRPQTRVTTRIVRSPSPEEPQAPVDDGHTKRHKVEGDVQTVKEVSAELRGSVERGLEFSVETANRFSSLEKTEVDEIEPDSDNESQLSDEVELADPVQVQVPLSSPVGDLVGDAPTPPVIPTRWGEDNLISFEGLFDASLSDS